MVLILLNKREVELLTMSHQIKLLDDLGINGRNSFKRF